LESKGIAYDPLLLAIIGKIGNNAYDHNPDNWRNVPGTYFAIDVESTVLFRKGESYNNKGGGNEVFRREPLTKKRSPIPKDLEKKRKNPNESGFVLIMLTRRQMGKGSIAEALCVLLRTYN